MNVFTVPAFTCVLVMFATSCLPVFAGQQHQGSGLVTLEGQILDSACALDASSAYQVIDMTPVPVGRLIREGESDPHPFSLRLVKCSLTRPDPARPGHYLPDWEHVRVTFEGLTDREGRSFAALGSSQGVALHITDANGQESIPGVPMDLTPLAGEDMVLNYVLQLVGNDQPMAVESHRAAVRFRLEYY